MTTAGPAISVVIATHNRPDALARCLASLRRQTLAADAFEVLVVDDGSPSPVCLRAGDTPRHTVLRRQAQQGPASARNHGLRIAKGHVIAFVDDDCEAEAGWLEALVRAAAAHPEAGYGGRVINALPQNRWSEASQLLVSYLCHYYSGPPGGPRFFTSNNLAFPREALVRAGGFSPRYQRAAGEDRELCDRWVGLGHRFVAVPDAIVFHAHHLSCRRFWRQHFTYGRGAWGFREARAHRHAEPVRIEPLRFYAGLLGYPLRVHGATGVTLSARLALAQCANALGFFMEASRPTEGRQE